MEEGNGNRIVEKSYVYVTYIVRHRRMLLSKLHLAKTNVTNILFLIIKFAVDDI